MSPPLWCCGCRCGGRRQQWTELPVATGLTLYLRALSQPCYPKSDGHRHKSTRSRQRRLKNIDSSAQVTRPVDGAKAQRGTGHGGGWAQTKDWNGEEVKRKGKEGRKRRSKGGCGGREVCGMYGGPFMCWFPTGRWASGESSLGRYLPEVPSSTQGWVL